VSVALLVEPGTLAVMVTVPIFFLLVVTMNWALVAPAGTMTVLGTCAQFVLSESDTTTPPAGAGDPRITVAVEDCPARITTGFSVSEVIGGGRTVSV
jgi:hypothetical protein